MDINEINGYEIESRLKKKNLDYDVIYKVSTDSTNNDAKKLAGKRNAVIVAGEQTAGKGRYGRTFCSQNNGGIYFTLRINQTILRNEKIADSRGVAPPDFAQAEIRHNALTVGDMTFFPLIAAVAVSRAVWDLCGIELRVKWPNDLLYKFDSGYKKVCGILTEAAIEAAKAAEAETGSVAYAIVGFGLNVNNDAADFPDVLKNTAASLKMISGKKYDRAAILCEIADYFTRFINMPRENLRVNLLEEYRQRLLNDISISFARNGKILRGTARGINENGNLTAELENGEITVIQSGEINFI